MTVKQIDRDHFDVFDASGALVAHVAYPSPRIRAALENGGYA